MDVVHTGHYSLTDTRTYALDITSNWYENGVALGTGSGSSYFVLPDPASSAAAPLGDTARGGGGCVKC